MEQRLYKATEQNEDLKYLTHTYEEVKVKMKKHLTSVQERFPHYSRHDVTHVKKIIDSIELILGKDRINKLSIGDVWMILVSAYLHDIGMLFSSDEEEEIWKFQSMDNFMSECEKGINNADILQAIKIIRNKDQNDQMKVNHSVTVLTAEYIRKNHAQRSRQIVDGNSPLSQLIKLPCQYAFRNEWEYVGKIIEHHGLDFSLILEEDFEPNLFPIPNCGNYHPRFVAALLRLGDLCDVQRGRFNEMSIAQFGLLPQISAQHYYKDQTMKHVHFNDKVIKMRAEIKFESITRELSDEQFPTKTKKEDFCQQVVYQHVQWFHMLKTELVNIDRYRDSIFPRGVPNHIAKFEPKIIVDTDEMILSLDDMRFNF